ncbi:hypothetical protein CC80DRAFT_53111 [Byssothecium circinans]|uniref:Uncharacterized protein n=1 Tax=Byssothecium circinans TaxID=147558 RepID=A0A6A5TX29_9PLEO|nr:hypothetical protein CC80DRAFT_53111 [Byssothecium circinans]
MGEGGSGETREEGRGGLWTARSVFFFLVAWVVGGRGRFCNNTGITFNNLTAISCSSCCLLFPYAHLSDQSQRKGQAALCLGVDGCVMELRKRTFTESRDSAATLFIYPFVFLVLLLERFTRRVGMVGKEKVRCWVDGCANVFGWLVGRRGKSGVS